MICEHSSYLPIVTISIVSHKQGSLVYNLLRDLQQYCPDSIEVLLTLNVKEDLPFECAEFTFSIQLIRNKFSKGFGANHNAAFDLGKGRYFCVMNPDIRLECNPFERLVKYCTNNSIGVIAPLVMNPKGTLEKSARRFPTPLSILAKIFGFEGPSDYLIAKENISVDWVGGMFMLFRNDVYKEIGGFNENYFLYYEDVDLCARIWMSGYQVLLCPEITIIHDARHDSHRNLKYMKWHLFSMTRFFLSRIIWRVNNKKVCAE